MMSVIHYSIVLHKSAQLNDRRIPQHVRVLPDRSESACCPLAQIHSGNGELFAVTTASLVVRL